MERWILYSFEEGAFWSNEKGGWGSFDNASQWTTENYIEHKDWDRPAGSQWLRITI